MVPYAGRCGAKVVLVPCEHGREISDSEVLSINPLYQVSQVCQHELAWAHCFHAPDGAHFVMASARSSSYCMVSGT